MILKKKFVITSRFVKCGVVICVLRLNIVVYVLINYNMYLI